MSVAPLLEVKDLVKRFPTKVKGKRAVVSAVTGVNFRLERGKTLGLVGESGSGKTTVGRCVLRLIEPDSGSIVFDGQDITRLPQTQLRKLRPRMQMVFQDPYRSLDPRLSVSRIILEPLRYDSRLNARQQRERMREVASAVGLSDRDLQRFPHQLSGGERQRVGIARAIATKPDLIVLDEPVSAVDIAIRAELIELLFNLQNEFGFSYIWISHDLTTVQRICHDVAVMYLSQITESGSVQQVFRSPRHPYGRALLSSVLLPDPGIKRTTYLLSGEIPSPIDLPKGCYLASRCPEVRDRCHGEAQVLQDSDSGGHLVRCWRAIAGELTGTEEQPWSIPFRDSVIADGSASTNEVGSKDTKPT